MLLSFSSATCSLLQNPFFRESKRNRMEHEYESEREPRSILQVPHMEIDLICGSGGAALLYKAIRFSLGCRHDGRPSRRDEGSLELYPGLFVPLDARGQ